MPKARRTDRDACSHLIEHNGEDLPDRLFLARKAALGATASTSTSLTTALRFRAPVPAWRRGIVSKRVDGTYRSGAPQSRRHRGAAGGQRQLEEMI